MLNLLNARSCKSAKDVSCATQHNLVQEHRLHDIQSSNKKKF